LPLMWIRKREYDALLDKVADLESEGKGLRETVQQVRHEWKVLWEELEDRIDRGNKAWRRVRRAQQSADDGMEEEEDYPLPEEHVAGGNGQGMLPLSNGVEPESPRHEQVARAYAQGILRKLYGDHSG
jgi:seryl-tRNA synthetase